MTGEQVTVRVTGRQFRHDGREYHTNDTLDVPRDVYEAWQGRLTIHEDTDDGADGAGEEEDSDEAVVDPHPSDLTVSELEDRIQDVDDTSLLHGILDAEIEGENRSTAVDAIEDRIQDLEG